MDNGFNGYGSTGGSYRRDGPSAMGGRSQTMDDRRPQLSARGSSAGNQEWGPQSGQSYGES